MIYSFLFLPSSTSEATDGTPRHPPSIQRIRALFGEKVDETSVSPSSNTAAQCHAESVREGWLHCKVTSIEGKVRHFGKYYLITYLMTDADVEIPSRKIWFDLKNEQKMQCFCTAK